MKFDFVIGNPPYQESKTTNNKSEAIYPFFYDAAIKIAEKSTNTLHFRRFASNCSVFPFLYATILFFLFICCPTYVLSLLYL